MPMKNKHKKPPYLDVNPYILQT